MLKSVITAACIGVLGGFWIALVDGSIEIFQNYVDGVWRYQIEFNSAAEILVGAVIGVLAGANIRLALDPERADGFVFGALVGLAVGILLALAQIAFVALSALLQIYDVEYGFLLTRFSGILAAAALIGAIAGLAEKQLFTRSASSKRGCRRARGHRVRDAHRHGRCINDPYCRLGRTRGWGVLLNLLIATPAGLACVRGHRCDCRCGRQVSCCRTTPTICSLLQALYLGRWSPQPQRAYRSTMSSWGWHLPKIHSQSPCLLSAPW